MGEMMKRITKRATIMKAATTEAQTDAAVVEKKGNQVKIALELTVDEIDEYGMSID
jgi:hypothetical protein